jgi:cardiolipin synthase
VGAVTGAVAKNLSRRSAFLFLALLVQLCVLTAAIRIFADNFYIFTILSIAASIAAVAWILSDASKPAYKLAWIIPILVVPVFGGLFYLFLGRVRIGKRLKKYLQGSAPPISTQRAEVPVLEQTLARRSPSAARQSRYLAAFAGSPLYSGTKTTYFTSGEAALEEMLVRLKAARKAIFLEFFIIEEGSMWGSILAVLEEKARQGLDVRVMYDDFGCLERLGKGYPEVLKARGINCLVFNPLNPIFSSDLNHRDHRKILVIDNEVGFTGGINLADEYINLKPRFGHWKDNALMLEGPGVASLSAMFLRLWHGVKKEPPPGDFLAEAPAFPEAQGYVQPFEDSPLDNEPVGEHVYLNIMGCAQKYIFITTPYLILDNEMTTAICLAAKGGVDVRIITPRVPDKWYVHMVSRSNYPALLRAGARIFEYEPGFIHAKSLVSDDAHGVVGTINLDFRSLYLHFECGVWMYGSEAISSMKNDFLKTQEGSVEIKQIDLDSEGRGKKALASVLRLFSPLM